MLLPFNKTDSNQLKVITHQKNDTKSFEFTLKDGKLMNIKIFQPTGQMLNETRLIDGKIVSYKHYHEASEDAPNPFIDNIESTQQASKLEYEVLLGQDRSLNHCKFYDKTTNNVIYDGGFIDSKKSGYGKKFYSSGKLLYDGTWLNDLMDGEGIVYFENGNVKYNGSFLRGKKNGNGVTFFSDGNKCYEGRYCMDNIIGDAKVFHSNGNLYMTGKFDFEYFKGFTFDENSQKRYEGEMTFDSTTQKYIRQGTGDSYWSNGQIEYSGGWESNKAEGYGNFNYTNGKLRYNGQFKDNKYNGFGAKYDESGRLMAEGQWKDGKFEIISLTDEH